MAYDALFPLLPHRGVGFRDIGPFLASPLRFEAYRKLAEEIERQRPNIELLAALDARGYLVAEGIAPYFASRPGVVQVRKKGKLPGVTTSLKFDYEYASAEFEVVQGSIKPGQKVVIVDDVLATGGSALAARQLVEQEGGLVQCLACLVNLEDLGGVERFGLPVVATTGFRGKRTAAEVQAQTQVALIPTVLQVGSEPPRTRDGPILLFPCPSQRAKAQRLVAYAPALFSLADVSWEAFPDGWGNIMFPDSDTLGEGNKHLIYLGSFYKPSYVMEQFSMVTAMCGQLAASYTLDFPFLPVTFERVTRKGAEPDAHGLVRFKQQAVATAHTLLKQLSGAMSGRPTLRHFDIHAEAVRFFNNDKEVLPLESSMLPSFLKLLATEYEESPTSIMVVFPDDGAYKRFMPFLQSSRYVIATCVKKRGAGEKREVSVKDIYYPVEGGKYELVPVESFLRDNLIRQIFLIDDLVQSGSTLRECAMALREGFAQVNINAFVIHPIFPQESHLRFVPGGKWAGTFNKFYVCDTVPEVAEKLRGLVPFQVLDTTPVLVDKYLRQFQLATHPSISQFYGKHLVYVASQSSKEKYAAVRNAFTAYYPFASALEVKYAQQQVIVDPVNPQPVGFVEALKGALQRLEAVETSRSISRPEEWVVSIENAAFLQPYTSDKYHDQAVVVVTHVPTGRTLYTCTHPVELDAECMAQSAASDYKHTAGQYIARKYHCSPTDWHATRAGMSRVDLLKEAIQFLLYQF
jgi:adenine phosphoribosyltransferase